MDASLRALLAELDKLGLDNDAVETERDRRLLNITADTGQLLAILIRSTNARQILEIGTSNGYSTLWLADAARDTGGHVTTIERLDSKIAMARENFVRGRLADRITQRQGVALDILTELQGPFDLIFLDADRPSYMSYCERLLELLRPGGLLVTDNVVSHAHELVEFLPKLKNDPRLDSVTLPVGNGEELTYKRA